MPIQWPPRKDTPWENVWSLKDSVNSKQFSMMERGIRFWTKTNLSSGPDLLLIQLPGWDVPADWVEAAEKQGEVRAIKEAHEWAARHGAKLNGMRCRAEQPIEYGVALEGLTQREGQRGVSRWWVDGSPGGGVLEIETQDAALVYQMATTWREAAGEAKERTAALLEMLRRVPE